MNPQPKTGRRLRAAVSAAILGIALLFTACTPAGEFVTMSMAMGESLGAVPARTHLENRSVLTLSFEDVDPAVIGVSTEDFARRAAEFVRDNYDGASALESVVVEIVQADRPAPGVSSQSTDVVRFSMNELQAES